MSLLNVNEIIVGSRIRTSIDYEKVKQLAQSINDVGLLNPILLNGKTLLAGVHRLEACKLLGMNEIPTIQIEGVDDRDSMLLIEIDENLFRNELTPRQRDKHIALRAEIIARSKLKDKVDEQIEKQVKKGKSKDNLIKQLDSIVNENCPDNCRLGNNLDSQTLNTTASDVLSRAKSSALAETKKELAETMGTGTEHITASINAHKAVKDMDSDKLDKLTDKDYKKVVSVAKKDKLSAEQMLDELSSDKPKSKESKCKQQSEAKDALDYDLGSLNDSIIAVRNHRIVDVAKSKKQITLANMVEFSCNEYSKSLGRSKPDDCLKPSDLIDIAMLLVNEASKRHNDKSELFIAFYEGMKDECSEMINTLTEKNM